MTAVEDEKLTAEQQVLLTWKDYGDLDAAFAAWLTNAGAAVMEDAHALTIFFDGWARSRPQLRATLGAAPLGPTDAGAGTVIEPSNSSEH